MPQEYHLSVSVANAAGEPLTEHGIEKNELKREVSCYIQSETGMAIQIHIKPKMPFPMFKGQVNPKDDRSEGKNASAPAV